MSKRFACGTPSSNCTGGITQLSHGIETKLSRTHSYSDEAHRCHMRYLMSLGCKPMGARELENPNTGAVLILSKKSKFGGKLKPGKKGKDGSKATRFMPNNQTGGVLF